MLNPAIMVKATLLESQSSVVKWLARRKKHLTTDDHLVRWSGLWAGATSQGGTLTNEVKQGDEWGTYNGLGRVMTTYRGIA